MMAELLDAKGVDRCAVSLMDYGAPVGFRMFPEAPDRVTGFIIQNGNAYDEGLREFWDPIKAYWADPSKENGDALRAFLTMDATQWQFTHGTQNPDAISPDNYCTSSTCWTVPATRKCSWRCFWITAPMWANTPNGRRCSANTSRPRC